MLDLAPCLAMAAMKAAVNLGEKKQVIVKKAMKKKKAKHPIDVWFQRHGLANAMRYAISRGGVPPPAPPWLAMAAKGGRGKRDSLLLVTQLAQDGLGPASISRVLKEMGFGKSRISQLLKTWKAEERQYRSWPTTKKGVLVARGVLYICVCVYMYVYTFPHTL